MAIITPPAFLLTADQRVERSREEQGALERVITLMVPDKAQQHRAVQP